MNEPITSSHIATAIAEGTIYSQWWFYVIWLLVTAIGAACGVWLREKIRGDVSKDIWLAQESWKEKYRLYTSLIQASESIASALFQIYSDTRVLSQMQGQEHSTEADGLKLFPEHRQYFDIEDKANEQLRGAEVGVELMLNAKARGACAKIRAANTRSIYVMNITYWQRIKERCDAASEAKAVFIEAAKLDLKI